MQEELYYLKHGHNIGGSQLLVVYTLEKVVVEMYLEQLHIVEYPYLQRQQENVHGVSIEERMVQDVGGDVVFFNVSRHENIHKTILIIPMQVKTNVVFAFPVQVKLEVIFQGVLKVFHIIFVKIFDAKVINTQAEDSSSSFMSP